MIQRIEKERLSACVAAIRRGFSTVADEFGLTIDNCPAHGAFMTLDRLQKDFEKGNLMFGLFEEGVLASFMQLRKVSETVYELEKLLTVPEHRHKGYGREMLAFAKATVRALNGQKMVIGIIEENARLKEWYLKNGFIHTGTQAFDRLPFTVGFMELDCLGGA